MEINAQVTPKVRSPEGRVRNRRTKAAWTDEKEAKQLRRLVHLGGAVATA